VTRTVRDELKRQSAECALRMVGDGMTIGIGTGTTARFFVEGLGRLIAEGMRLRGIATSVHSAELARAAGLELVEDVDGPIDLAVDGADEIAPDLGLIKGRGGALLREKLVAAAADQFVIIADSSKLVPRLGVGVLPVEVVPFLWRQTAARLESLGLRVELRMEDGRPYVTDNGNRIVDTTVPGGIDDSAALAASLKAQLGVVEHGLFLGLADGCIVAGEDGITTMGHVPDYTR
jgi:ribose 5-phosphate isomerase A